MNELCLKRKKNILDFEYGFVRDLNYVVNKVTVDFCILVVAFLSGEFIFYLSIG